MAVQVALTTSITTGASTANIVQGTQLEIMQVNCQLVMAVVAANATAAQIFLTWSIGDEIVVDDQAVSNANRWPISPDDWVYSTGATRGDRQVVRLRNINAGTIVVYTLIKQQPASLIRQARR